MSARSRKPVEEVVVSPMRAAFRRYRAQMEALAPGELAYLNVDIPGAVTTVLGALPAMKALRDALLEEMPHFDAKRFDALEGYTLALAQAQGVYMSAAAPPADVVPLNEEGGALRETLLSDARALAHRGLIDPDSIAGFKTIPGYRNLAFDLVGLSNLFLEAWPRVEGKTALGRAELERAQTLSNQLLVAVAQRARAPSDSAAEASDLRHRAFTLFVRAYDEARSAIAYLRRHEGDAESIAPSLYAGRGRRKANEPAGPPVETSPPAGPPGEPPAAAPAPVTTLPAARLAVPRERGAGA